jgi:hypothetical protein
VNAWIRRSVRLVVLTSALSFFGGSTIADPLPKNAKPLTGAEVRELYSGRSIIWGRKQGAYFASNGRVISVYTNWHNDINPSKKWTGYTTGTWSVAANQICWRYSGFDLIDKKSWSGGFECWKWYRANSQYWSFHVKKPRGKRPS